jgi:aminocarboxymuconate-semialdehyde decarboxylase
MYKSDGTLFRVVERNCYCPETRIAECNSTDVSIQVLSTVPGIGFNYTAPAKDALTVAKYLNDHISQLVGKYPTRFVGLGTIPLQDPSLAILELRRCILELGMAGVQIGSHVNGRCLDDDALEPLWTVELVQNVQFV